MTEKKKPEEATVSLALMKRDVVDVVDAKVQEFIHRGELHLPEGYSPDNAMKSAWLILQNVKDKAGKPVLATCTNNSIANALLDMVVQGLNPAKNQGYFIAYGNQLTFQRSYFGTMALLKSIDDTIADIIAEVVYEGDDFEFEIVRGRKEVTKHKQTLASIQGKKIVAAYCMVIDTEGRVRRTDIMTFDEIKQAWRKSQVHPIDEKGNVKAASTHGQFTAEMTKKTVINRTCKPLINSSSDSHLLRRSAARSDEIRDEDDIEAAIEDEANSIIIDIDEAVVEDAEEPEPEKLPEPEPEKAQKSRKTAKKEEKEPEKAQKAKNVPEGPDF